MIEKKVVRTFKVLETNSIGIDMFRVKILVFRLEFMGAEQIKISSIWSFAN